MLTLAAKQDRQVPQLSHIERLEDLALITGSVTVQGNSRILVPIVLMCESETGTDRNLRTNNAISTIKALGKHVHGSSFAVRNTLSSTKKLSNDGFDGSTAHEGKAVAAVGGDDVVFLSEGVLDPNGDGFLTGGEMAETADLLLLVKSVCSHFHTTVDADRQLSFFESCWDVELLPDGYHIVVHLLQLLLRGIEGIRWGIKLVGLERLVGEVDLEWFIIFLLIIPQISLAHSSMAERSFYNFSSFITIE